MKKIQTTKFKQRSKKPRNNKSSSKFFFRKKKFIYNYIFYIKIILDIILTILYFFLKNNRKKIPTICLCTLGKRENLYAKEFINYYKKLGYTHIYLYDNNDVDGEKFEDVLQDEINSNFVSIINYRGIVGKICQIYEECYEKNNKNYDWLSFFDFDEFLDIKPYANTIQEFLLNKRYENCTTIKVNFLFYSDNELLHYDNRPLQERFTQPLPEHQNNQVVKTTVRGGLNSNYWSVNCRIHTSEFECYSCNSSGEKVDHKAMQVVPTFKYARLKHYYTKSIEEYVNKCTRGETFFAAKWDDARKKFKYDLFFLYNKKTKEKEEMLKKVLNMTL